MDHGANALKNLTQEAPIADVTDREFHAVDSGPRWAGRRTADQGANGEIVLAQRPNDVGAEEPSRPRSREPAHCERLPHQSLV
jgi:hypothetical protein